MKHLLLLLTLIATQASAQIIYTDVVPDLTYAWNPLPQPVDTCHLDVNNDGAPDFHLMALVQNITCGSCPPAISHPHSIQLDPHLGNAAANSTGWISELAALDVIDASFEWNGSQGQVLETYDVHCSGGSPNQCVPWNWSGLWLDGISVSEPRYLGLRFAAMGNTYYGWARISIQANATSVKLYDYAYNSVPDELILAGDSGVEISTGIARIAHPNVQVSPNPFTSALSVSFGPERAGNITCAVRSLSGQELVSRTIPGGRSSFTLDLGSLASGAYLLEVMMDGERFVRKVMKE